MSAIAENSVSKPSRRVRRILDGESLEQVAELGATIYGSETPLAELAYLNWKFHGNPYGTVAVVWEVDNHVLGCGAFVRVPMKIGPLSLEGGIGADTMVHPDFRLQGIAGVVTYESLKLASGVAVAYGIHEAQSATVLGLTQHLDFQVVGEVRYFKKYLSPLSVFARLGAYERDRFRRLGYFAELVWITLAQHMYAAAYGLRGRKHTVNNEVTVRESNLQFGDEFDLLWEEVAPSLTIAVERRKEYLKWRYANPSGNYRFFRADCGGKLRGYCIFVYENRGGVKTARIVDLLFATVDAGASLLEACIRRSKQDGAHVLKMYRNQLSEQVSRESGLIEGWGRSTVIARTIESNVPRNIVSEIRNWFLTGTDIEDGL